MIRLSTKALTVALVVFKLLLVVVGVVVLFILDKGEIRIANNRKSHSWSFLDRKIVTPTLQV